MAYLPSQFGRIHISSIINLDQILMLRASSSIDSVTPLAAYRTGLNVVGLGILLPLIGPFTRMIERILRMSYRRLRPREYY